MDGTHDKNGVIAPQQASQAAPLQMLQPTRIRFPIPILSSRDDRPSGHRTLHLVNPDRYVVELARRSPRTRPRPGGA